MLREFIVISLQNLWRMKLRSALTIAGIMIGIGALVSMLSFGLGVQKNVTHEFHEMGLLRTLQVTPGKGPARSAESKGSSAAGAESGAAGTDSAESGAAAADSTARRSAILDESALRRIAAVPGVAMAYPQISFRADVSGLDSGTVRARVQAVPPSFFERRPFGSLVAGDFFRSDTTREAVVSARWLARHKLDPDSAVGRTIRVRAAGGGEVILGVARLTLGRFGLPEPLLDRGLQLAGRLVRRFLSSEREVRIVGVAEIRSGFGFFQGEILLPTGLVGNLDFLSFNDPLDLAALLAEPAAAGWPMIVVTLDQEKDYARVRREIEAMGFGIFSFSEQLDQIRKSFLVFDAFVAIIGLIALLVAALGIVNTMVMSITERTREIGILKSLGAQEEQIRFLFLVESGAIGLAGSLAGIILGLAVSRVAAVVARELMIRQDVPPVDLFHLPLWVFPPVILFGVLLSIVAGLYPAARAARVDPVQALRHD